MHVMNADSSDERAQAPTAEALAGRLLRLLRESRGWSQKQVAERMRAYGYSWNQSTITRIESASRPLRLNELADLAILFGVPVAQLLERDPLLGEEDGVEDLDREIIRLKEERAHLVGMRRSHQHALDSASRSAAEVSAEIARVDASLQVLMRWRPHAVKRGGTQ